MPPHTTPFPLRALRLSRLALHLLYGAAVAAFLLPHCQPDVREDRIRQWCAKLLAIVAVRVRVCGKMPEAPGRILFVANHISWLDIWILKHCMPAHLIAKSEIRSWPLIGWLAHQVGTLFIERERRLDTGRVMQEISAALQRGECLCLFPEGTTSDGTELKPFKGGLLQAAIDTRAMVWPVALRYPNPDGSVNVGIAYHGTTTLWQSLKAVLSQREIIAELHFCEPLEAGYMKRRQIALAARHAIASALHLRAHKAPETADGLPGVPH